MCLVPGLPSIASWSPLLPAWVLNSAPSQADTSAPWEGGQTPRRRRLEVGCFHLVTKKQVVTHQSKLQCLGGMPTYARGP